VTLGSSQGQLNYITTEQLVTGKSYRFQVKATNYIGPSPLSNTGTLLSANIPDTPTSPTIYAATET
jgi:hypothetical protein